MTLTHIFVFILIALLAGLFLKERGRNWFLLTLSILGIFWLQPASALRNMDFWVPTATLGLTVIIWAASRSEGEGWSRQNIIEGSVIAGLVLLVGLNRYLPAVCCLIPTPPPLIGRVLVALVVLGALAWLFGWLFSGRLAWLNVLVLAVVGVFIILKTESLTLSAAAWLRGITGQKPELASVSDVSWLGFSYVAFRLMHVLRDRAANRLPSVSLGNFIIYVVFPPAFTAGPIDKIQRFAKDLEKQFSLDAEQLLGAGKRLAIGIFMKFVLADSLALMAINSGNVTQTTSTGWMWILVYGYSFQIMFDFVGYTHIAIGLGMLFGIQLPENFLQPYSKPNLTAFWNSWHITLAQWFRGYYFNPLSRALRTRKVPVWAIIFFGQISTMVLIGLWHGVTWNFIIWGAWHGVGLFLHNRWAELIKKRPLNINPKLGNVLGVLLTFHFVALGWVWFALPTLEQALHVLSVLFGGAA